MKVINLTVPQEDKVTEALQAIYNLAEEKQDNETIHHLVTILETLNIEIYM
jgi:ferritin